VSEWCARDRCVREIAIRVQDGAPLPYPFACVTTDKPLTFVHRITVHYTTGYGAVKKHGRLVRHPKAGIAETTVVLTASLPPSLDAYLGMHFAKSGCPTALFFRES
jgi:hypothetical protein